MRITSADILTILSRHTPGLTLASLESCMDQKLVSLIEDKIGELVMSQISTLTLGELIALHQDLTSQVEPPKPVGFTPEPVNPVVDAVAALKPKAKPKPKLKPKRK